MLFVSSAKPMEAGGGITKRRSPAMLSTTNRPLGSSAASVGYSGDPSLGSTWLTSSPSRVGRVGHPGIDAAGEK